MYCLFEVFRVEYDFYIFNVGMVDVYIYVLFIFFLYVDWDYKLLEYINLDIKYSVCIDDGFIFILFILVIEYFQIWYDSVLKNCRVNKFIFYVKVFGKYILQICCGDFGIVIQKIVIDMGGFKRLYLGFEIIFCC